MTHRHCAERGWRRPGLLATALVIALGLTTTALATPTTIGDVDLTAADGAVFEADNDDWGCSDGTSSSGDGFYTPADDASIGSHSDAFDSALILYVGDDGFVDKDGIGNHVGEQLTVGPTRVGGLRVTRIDRALPGTRTLRSLIKLQNPKKKAVTKYVTLDTELGADDDTVIEGSSSDDLRFNSKDRWGIMSDEAVSDPATTLVNYGKGRVAKPILQIGPYPDTGDDGADCILDVFRVRIGAKQTVYMMFFLEVAESVEDASTSVRKFNKKRLSKPLLAGIKPRARSKILNWDL